jgi:hypothetical protein
MDNSDYVKWFEAVFKGRWSQLPAEEPISAEVLDDSREWARLLLDDRSNPYSGGRLDEQNMFLGLEKSPDKLITTAGVVGSNNGIEIYETLQHFIVKSTPARETKIIEDPKTALAKQAESLNVFSADAKRIVNEVMKTVGALPNNVYSDSAVLLSTMGMSISAISRWSDLIGLFWFAGELYVDFPKACSGLAVATFRSGLDWYPEDARARLGVPRMTTK